jgi:hypothetical protein
MYSYLDKQLITLLEERFTIISSQHLGEIGWRRIKKSKWGEEVITTYKNLGGIQQFPIFNLPKKYILLENNFVVLLDEILHFNRYRMATFRSSLYEAFPELPLEPYRNYCRKHERECLKSGMAGDLWTSPFSEKHFGSAAERGDFNKNGAPAWKLRAMEDYMLDAGILLLNKKLMRIALYQQLMINRQLYKVGDILTAGTAEQRNALLNYIERKISS